MSDYMDWSGLPGLWSRYCLIYYIPLLVTTMRFSAVSRSVLGESPDGAGGRLPLDAKEGSHGPDPLLYVEQIPAPRPLFNISESSMKRTLPCPSLFEQASMVER